MRPCWQIALLETCEQHQVLDMHGVQPDAVEPFFELKHLRPVLLGDTLPRDLAITDVADRSDGVLEPHAGSAVRLDLNDERKVADLGRLRRKRLAVARKELPLDVERASLGERAYQDQVEILDLLPVHLQPHENSDVVRLIAGEVRPQIQQPPF
jgi:hypothetical protein